MTKKTILGISALSHDASVSVIRGEEILFAAHAERTTNVKNSKFISKELMDEALSHGTPDVIAFYEKPILKKTRQFFAGQYDLAFNGKLPSTYINEFPELKGIPVEYVSHHLSHAAAGALTSPYDECTVVVIDAIGEWDCLTIWKYSDNEFEKLYSMKYPNSLGLFYTAFTQRVGLKPNEDEYILMGMAAYGEPKYYDQILKDFFIEDEVCELTFNLHRGCGDYLENANDMDIAASVQKVVEKKISDVISHSKKLNNSDNLVYMGGVALNCVANSKILHEIYDNVWIMPNPGDAGSSLGAAAYINGQKLNWESPYLGHEIKGEYPIEDILAELENTGICGVANGKAEFGPRALGNRSLLADPRGYDIQDRMNDIKKRQKFRPFAPVIMEDMVHKYFDMPADDSKYMQYVGVCKYPNVFPAISHVDGTSRVQTVSKEDHPDLYELLKRFYEKTGCPMLLNTSLNIKGRPMVDNEDDARVFSEYYGVKVFTSKDK